MAEPLRKEGTSTEKPAASRLLAFARELQHAATFRELLEATRKEAFEATGYPHAWLFVSDTEDAREWRLIDIAGSQRDLAWEVAPVLHTKGDAMLEEIVASDEPVVVIDARTDPRTDKNMVAAMGNRTIINIPLRLLDKPLGALGVGTYGDEEGCRPPTREQLDHLIGMGNQLSVAAGRIRFLEERARAEKEKLDLERRLFQAQKLESLGLLAGGVAHDFNNLLTIILGSASLAREVLRTSPRDATRDLDTAIAAAERGRSLTQQLLAMSRRQKLKLSPIDLNDRLRQLLGLLQRLLPENIEVQLIPGAHLPLVEGDASQLDQVFMNLCINARDAMPQGGLLTIQTEHVTADEAFTKTQPWATHGIYVLATVKDTGSGMTAEVRDRIFEPFFSTKKERAGTGLGLAVVYGIVRQHAGMVRCESEPGAGAIIKVYLPGIAAEAPDEARKPESAVRGGYERILVAEDDPAVRGVTQRVLASAGYDVTAVADGAAACAAAARESFDLAILDVVMPGMSAQQTMERIAAVLPRARFLLSSGYTADMGALAAIERGKTKLLEKPYDPDGLLRTVRGVLDERLAPR